MPVRNSGGTLGASTPAVMLASSNNFNKYFMLQNQSTTDDLWFGHTEANTVATKAFVLEPGGVAAINTNDQGVWELWAMASGAVAVEYVLSTSGTIA